MTDKELFNLLGLDGRSIKLTLEEDILNTMDDFTKDYKEHEEKKKEFLSLFKECYDDIVKIIQADTKQRIAVDCYTCVKGMDLSKKYGKPKSKK